jgi:hypothetical protein
VRVDGIIEACIMRSSDMRSNDTSLPPVLLGPDSGRKVAEYIETKKQGAEPMTNEASKSGLVLRTNGKIERVDISGLEDMQAAVGGLIQPLPIEEQKHGFSLYLNEEGRLKALPINMTASLWLLRNDIWPGLDEPIHGDVLILGPTNEDGESTTMDSQDIEDTIPRYWVEPSFSFTIVE